MGHGSAKRTDPSRADLAQAEKKRKTWNKLSSATTSFAVVSSVGSRLYQIFFKTYTEKVWGIPCTEISDQWASQRIKNLNLWDVSSGVLLIREAGGQVSEPTGNLWDIESRDILASNTLIHDKIKKNLKF